MFYKCSEYIASAQSGGSRHAPKHHQKTCSSSPESWKKIKKKKKKPATARNPSQNTCCSVSTPPLCPLPLHTHSGAELSPESGRGAGWTCALPLLSVRHTAALSSLLQRLHCCAALPRVADRFGSARQTTEVRAMLQ